MKKLALFAFLLVFLPQQARALSCAVPPFDKDAINYAAAVFEGTVIRHGTNPVNKVVGRIQKLETFVFRVDVPWKGVNKDQQIEVISDTYWGNMYQEGASFLMVVHKNEDGDFASHLCGHSRPADIEYAEKMRTVLKTWCETSEECGVKK